MRDALRGLLLHLRTTRCEFVYVCNSLASDLDVFTSSRVLCLRHDVRCGTISKCTHRMWIIKRGGCRMDRVSLESFGRRRRLELMKIDGPWYSWVPVSLLGVIISNGLVWLRRCKGLRRRRRRHFCEDRSDHWNSLRDDAMLSIKSWSQVWEDSY